MTCNMMLVNERLEEELKELKMCPGILAAVPDAKNFHKWTVVLKGPKGSPYAEQVYCLLIQFPSKYPFEPPSVTFNTRCFHPNVDISTGAISLDILKVQKWSALTNVKYIFSHIQNLLCKPYVHSPLNKEAARLWNRKVEFGNELSQLYQKYKTNK